MGFTPVCSSSAFSNWSKQISKPHWLPIATRDHQLCRLVTTSGLYLTINNTFSEDPAQAVTAERWFLEMKAAAINTTTVVIRV